MVFLFVLFLCDPVYSQTTKYVYACGDQSSVQTWTESREGNQIHLKTVQGSEIHQYVMTADYQTVSWKYFDAVKNTKLEVVLEQGVYRINGILRSRPYSKTLPSRGNPWYQNVGFHVGYSIEGKTDFTFECIRPDNLKCYEMQAETKELINHEGKLEQRIYIHLTGMLARFFGSDYYIDPSTQQFVRYKGVHGPPGTPETTITIIK